jgi:hypothetical protein
MQPLRKSRPASGRMATGTGMLSRNEVSYPVSVARDASLLFFTWHGVAYCPFARATGALSTGLHARSRTSRSPDVDPSSILASLIERSANILSFNFISISFHLI